MRRALTLVLIGAAPLALLGACSSGTSQDDSGGTTSLTVGASAQAFSLPSAQGGTVSLADFRGKKPVLLYFSMGPG